jgi:serpin B
MFYSPYSISTALAMIYAGAAGDTEQQMSDALHFTLPQQQLHPAFNKLALELANNTYTSSVSLSIVNDLWCQEDYKFLPAFLDVLAQNYSAGVNLLDFTNAPENSRQIINNWVSSRTYNHIQDLIPQGGLDSLTKLVVTNAIYFNGEWSSVFQTAENNAFSLLDGSTVNVPMMKNDTAYYWGRKNGCMVVELPYKDDKTVMDIIMPDAGTFSTFESTMTAASVFQIVTCSEKEEVKLTMPKFHFDSSFSLKEALTALGMPIVFTDKADFSGINGYPELYIKDVVHKAYVSVDEVGTQAGAGSAGTVMTTSVPVSITVDRPFIFVIRDIKTSAIIFVGRVLNPAQ